MRQSFEAAPVWPPLSVGYNGDLPVHLDMYQICMLHVADKNVLLHDNGRREQALEHV